MLEESSTYQLILSRGFVQGRREVILWMGNKKFGPPSPETRNALEQIRDRKRLLDVDSWEELLPNPNA